MTSKAPGRDAGVAALNAILTRRFWLILLLLIFFIRVVIMMTCGACWPEFFEPLHFYGWQAIIMFTMLGRFFLAERFAWRRPQARLGGASIR